MMWKDDHELFSLVRKELFTALVGDVLDQMGYLHQFLSPGLKPLVPSMVVIGRAMPVLEEDISAGTDNRAGHPFHNKPFGRMFEALDDLKENEVYLCTGSFFPYALWGGLMTTRAVKLGAAGAVVNGYSRDTSEVIRLNFPVFSTGTYAQDQGPRGRVTGFRIPVEWDGITIHPGDIIYGDRDGVLVVPREAEKEAFMGAFEKARDEKLVLKALQSGMGAGEAFDKFGIM